MQAADLDTPAVLGEHLEANGRAKDGKDQHEDDVHTHLPGICHQVKHPASTLQFHQTFHTWLVCACLQGA